MPRGDEGDFDKPHEGQYAAHNRMEHDRDNRKHELLIERIKSATQVIVAFADVRLDHLPEELVNDATTFLAKQFKGGE